MCRLFAFRSNVPSQAHHALVTAENAVAFQAEYHSDGWGIGYYLDGEPYLFRASKGAAEDHRFQMLSESLRSHTFLVHVRKATVGDIDSLNSHPFRYGAWMFAHNGTIFEFSRLEDRIMKEILPVFRPLIFGSTDSERYFYFLLSHMVRAGCDQQGRSEINVAVAVEAQREALSKIFQWSKEEGIEAPKANYILTNGSVMFARRAGLELYLATQKKMCKEVLVCKEEDKFCLNVQFPSVMSATKAPRPCKHIIFASEPTGNENIWEEIPDGALVSIDSQLMMRLHDPPSPFWVTWPSCVTKHPRRQNVISCS
ncbi:MAG: class II glutamine amidotransferase [Myxococcota bacterium]|nr:class II glutamine amidotransferase [Myxococcota bacterium]